MTIERGEKWQRLPLGPSLYSEGNVYYDPSRVVVVEATFPGWVVYSPAAGDRPPELVTRYSFLKGHIPFDRRNGRYTLKTFVPGFDKRYKVLEAVFLKSRLGQIALARRV